MRARVLQARVEAAGGQILFWNGVRVMGVLAVSRAIGDHCLRPFVIAEPEVRACRCLGRLAHSTASCCEVKESSVWMLVLLSTCNLHFHVTSCTVGMSCCCWAMGGCAHDAVF